jgi:flagellar hook protein FlgE
MALTSALYTGLSGLDVNQTRLSVVGNNIANVNTVAFKSSRVLFKPQFYVTDSAGTAPSSGNGGTNPSQHGLGADVGSIEKDFTPGSLEPTGKPTDMAIDGDGFFIVQGSQQQFTRDGSFVLNEAHQLVTTGGQYVQGFGADKNGNIIPGQLQDITVPLGSLTNAKATGNVNFQGNLNANGAVATGASILNSGTMYLKGGSTWAGPMDATVPLSELSATAGGTPLFNTGDVLTLDGQKGGRNLAEATYTVTGTDTLGDLGTFFQSALGIDTTVPSIPGGPTPGVTADPSGTGVMLTVTGNTGTDNALTLPGSSFFNQSGTSPLTFADGQDALGNKSDPNGESVNTSVVVYDSLGTPLTVNVTAVLENKTSAGNTWRFYTQSADDTDVNLDVGTGTLTFDSQGRLQSSTGATMTIDRDNTGSGTPLVVNMDFGSMTSLTSGKSSLTMTAQDGSPIGTLNSFSIGADGTVVGSFSNGMTQTLGQVGIATFTNNLGLNDTGGNLYQASANSGLPIISAPQTQGAGAVRSGALEMSNVDISKEFINMIISSTGFSAASRVITTSDQLMQELLNSSR